MTHLDQMLAWFKAHGNQATLRQILDSHERWSYEFRARLADAKRQRGVSHTCELREPRSENLYKIIEPDGEQMRLAI